MKDFFKLAKESQKIYDALTNKSNPIFEMIMCDKRHSEDYRKGFTDGFHQIKMDLLAVLTPPLSLMSLGKPKDTKSITVKGHAHLLETLLKVMGKIDAFYRLVEVSEDTENLFLLITEDLNFLQEIIGSDFK